MDAIIILNDEQLRKLAKIIYYREVEAIHNIKFKSEPERAKYIKECRDSYQTTLDILINGGAALSWNLEQEQQQQQHDNVRTDPIAHDIFCYVKCAVNVALQQVRNYTLRIDYLQKIKQHSRALIEEFRNVVDVKKKKMKSMGTVQRLAKEAVEYKNAMLENCKRLQKGPSRIFSKLLMEQGINFEQLVERYKAKLGYNGPFRNLKEVQKLEVYEKIIEASGRGKSLVNKITTGMGAVGIAVLLFTAGMIVWDVYSSEHKLETTVRDIVAVASGVGGTMLGQVVATAMAAKFLPGAVAGMGAILVTVTGIILGFVGAFILGLFTSWLVNLIFGSGGSNNTFDRTTEELNCYVAPLPDGHALARQIAHLDRFKN